MSRVAWIIMLAALAAVPADAQTTDFPTCPAPGTVRASRSSLGGGN